MARTNYKAAYRRRAVHLVSAAEDEAGFSVVHPANREQRPCTTQPGHAGSLQAPPGAPAEMSAWPSSPSQWHCWGRVWLNYTVLAAILHPPEEYFMFRD